MIKKKNLILGLGAISPVTIAFVAVSCANTSATNKFVNIAFLPIADVQLTDTLSAQTGGNFTSSLPSYENDGNENVTTRAGLRVRKSSVISALKENLGVDIENKIGDNSKFFTALNKLLSSENGLVAADFTDLESVEITIDKSSNTTTLFSDLVADSRIKPIVTHMVNFIFHAKEGKGVGKQMATRLKISGMAQIRLSDYRRVDETTLVATTNKPTLEVNAVKPDSVTLNAIIEVLNKHFNISDEKFRTPLFPIWNSKSDGTPLYLINNVPVKHSLANNQVVDLQKLYSGTAAEIAANRNFGNFPAARITRAVEEVYFTLPSSAVGTTIVNGSGTDNVEYEVTLNLNMDFIKHWSWGITPHSDFVKTFTLPVTFKVKFATNSAK